MLDLGPMFRMQRLETCTHGCFEVYKGESEMRSCLIADQPMSKVTFQMEGRPSSIVCAFFKQSTSKKEKKVTKRLARGALGPWARDMSFAPGGHETTVQVKRRLAFLTKVW